MGSSPPQEGGGGVPRRHPWGPAPGLWKELRKNSESIEAGEAEERLANPFYPHGWFEIEEKLFHYNKISVELTCLFTVALF